METLSWVGITLIIGAGVAVITGGLKKRPRVYQAGQAGNVLGCLVMSACYAVAGSYVSLTIFVLLTVFNAAVLLRNRSIQRRKAAA